MKRRILHSVLIVGLLISRPAFADTWWDDFQDSYFCSYADAYAIASPMYAMLGLIGGPVGWAFTGYSVALSVTSLACNWPGEGPG